LNVKIGNTNLNPLPDSLTVQSPQKIAEIELPHTQNAFQDFGPGPKRFSLGGILRASDGGIKLALAFDETKRKGEEVIFAIGQDASWKVRIQQFNFDLLRRGNIRYTMDLVEVSEPEPFVFMPQPEIYAPDRMQAWIALIKLQAKGFELRGALAQVHNAIWKLEEGLAKIKNMIRDIRELAELPANQLNLLKFELGICLLQCDIIKQEAKRILDAPQRNYSAAEEMIKYVYQYVQAIATEGGVMYTACLAVPKKEQTYTVRDDDTLQGISVKYYNTPNRWSEIAAANDILDPTLIVVGQELEIPV